MNLLYPISTTAMLLGVSVTTIRRWHKSNKINCFRTVGNHRRFSLSEIRRVLLGRKRRERKVRAKNRSVIYARVSSHDQKDDLGRQQKRLEDYCRDNNLDNVSVYRDIASGLNAKRRGLLRLLKHISGGGINYLVITYRDRLTRFGFSYLETFCQYFGVTIISIAEDEKQEKSMEQELAEDLVAIITSFSGRMHGLRSSKTRKKKKLTK